MLGGDVDTRWRVMFTTTDITTITSGNIIGTKIDNVNNPAAYRSSTFNCTEDGYVILAKDNIGKIWVKSYMYNTTIQNYINPSGMVRYLEANI